MKNKLFIKYFHELTRPEYRKFCKGNPHMTYAEIEKRYPQPPWCNYPEAVMGVMGCWSLTSFMVKGREYCVTCDCLKKKVKP
jgi:hypothetical protein